MNRIPERFPSEVVDRLIAAAGHRGNWFHGLELEFEKRLDPDRLARAARLTLDAEPVLGCRWVPEPRRPVWRRVSEAERDNFSLFEDGAAYETWKRAGLPIESGPQFRVAMLRGADTDRLLLGLSHAVCDGGGIRDVAAMCARIYTRLASDPEFSPSPNLSGSRSIDQVREEIPLRAYPRIAANLIQEVRGARREAFPCLGLPKQSNGPEAAATAVVWTIEPARVTELKAWGRPRGATLNDIMLVAFFRGLVEVAAWDGRLRLTATTTADLRRYLPSGRAGAVCNLSSAQTVRLGTDLGTTFEESLVRVSRMMRRRKANWMGLTGPLFVLPLLRHVPYDRLCAMVGKFDRAQRRKPDRQPLVFTNAGRIDPEELRFDSPPIGAYNWPQLLRPPLMQVIVSGYGDGLTLSSGVFPSGRRERAARALYEAMGKELPV